MPLIDRGLVSRLEQNAANLAVATAAVHPSGRSVSLSDGVLVLLGPGRYVNRAIGTTLDGLDDADLDAIERASIAAGVAPAVEVCSWAPAELLTRLAGRGYRPSWFRDVFVRTPGVVATEMAGIAIRPVVGDEDMARWLRVLADGNEFDSADGRAVSDEFALAAHRLSGAIDLLAEIDGTPAGCGSLVHAEGIEWLGGAATVPAFRRRGVQSALLAQRLTIATRADLELVSATALPDSTSARNLRRCGFTLAYTQVVMAQETR